MGRLISHYAFVRRTPEHPLHAHVIDQRLTFEDYVASGLTTELNDGGVRLLCGREDAETVGYGRVTRAMLEDAKANLRKHFLAVGTTERFQESVLLFQQLLHWKRVEEYRSLNRSERRETSLPLTDQARSLIARYNALDLELYDYARQLLQDSLAIHGIDRTALVRFRARIIAHRLRLRAHIIKYRVAHRIRTTIARAGGR
jgi:hypothetical protein